MENRSKKESKINTLPDNDKQSIKLLVRKLEELNKNDKITEETLTELESVVIELCLMKDRHSKYLIRWFKQGYMDI